MKFKNGIFLLAVVLLSCDSAYNAEKVAERYCDCMRNNGSPGDFERASVICDKKLIGENRYVKLYSVDMNDRELDKKVSNETRDSVISFISKFTIYINSHCCRETLGCPDSTELK